MYSTLSSIRRVKLFDRFSFLANLLQVKIDDLNITMEEYIRFDEEKAHRHGKVYNWETATYGKIWYDEDVYHLRSVETEFPTIVFDDMFTSEVTHSCKPTVSIRRILGEKDPKIDRLARSLLIQGLSNDIYSLIDSNETAKDLWDALERQMRSSEYAEQDRKASILYEYETFKATEEEQNLMDINIDALYNILKQNQGDVNDSLGYKKKVVMVTSDPLALVAEKTKVSKRKEKVKVQTESEGSDDEDINCKKAKVKDYNYCKTKMLLAKKDSDEQVLLAEDQAWIESSSDSDQEINVNMVFMAQIEKVLSDSDKSSSSAEETKSY
nr:hypothetical protein [Tanacetum cinerariifolium]